MPRSDKDKNDKSRKTKDDDSEQALVLDAETDWSGVYTGDAYHIAFSGKGEPFTETAYNVKQTLTKVGAAAFKLISAAPDGIGDRIGLAIIDNASGQNKLYCANMTTGAVSFLVATKIRKDKVILYQDVLQDPGPVRTFTDPILVSFRGDNRRIADIE